MKLSTFALQLILLLNSKWLQRKGICGTNTHHDRTILFYSVRNVQYRNVQNNVKLIFYTPEFKRERRTLQNLLAVVDSVIIKGTFMQYKFLVQRVIYASSWINKLELKISFSCVC